MSPVTKATVSDDLTLGIRRENCTMSMHTFEITIRLNASFLLHSQLFCPLELTSVKGWVEMRTRNLEVGGSLPTKPLRRGELFQPFAK